MFLSERQFKMTTVYVSAVLISILFAAMSLLGLEAKN
jgi:hypothetical protein